MMVHSYIVNFFESSGPLSVKISWKMGSIEKKFLTAIVDMPAFKDCVGRRIV